jgi:hypothetical protein
MATHPSARALKVTKLSNLKAGLKLVPHFSIENPTMGLANRPYMNKGWIEREFCRSEVNYCVYQHMYMYKKPTHIWSTLPNWELRGMIGNGLCRAGNRCNMGSIGEKGFYNHKKRLG